MSLIFALRLAATLLILSAAFQYFTFNQLLIKTIVVAHVLFILSIFDVKHLTRISVVSLGLAIVVPIGAWRMYENGDGTLGFLLFNLIIFTPLAFVSISTLKNSSKL